MAKKIIKHTGILALIGATLATPAEKIYNIIDQLNSNASDSLAQARELSQQAGLLNKRESRLFKRQAKLLRTQARLDTQQARLYEKHLKLSTKFN